MIKNEDDLQVALGFALGVVLGVIAILALF